MSDFNIRCECCHNLKKENNELKNAMLSLYDKFTKSKQKLNAFKCMLEEQKNYIRAEIKEKENEWEEDHAVYALMDEYNRIDRIYDIFNNMVIKNETDGDK